MVSAYLVSVRQSKPKLVIASIETIRGVGGLVEGSVLTTHEHLPIHIDHKSIKKSAGYFPWKLLKRFIDLAHKRHPPLNVCLLGLRPQRDSETILFLLSTVKTNIKNMLVSVIYYIYSIFK